MHRLRGKGSTLGVREAHGSEARSLRNFESKRNLRALEQDCWVCLVVWSVDSVVPPLHYPLQ